jgi:UDP-glucose 4-epimerase
MTKVLVTGGAGFIGSNIVDRYLEAGHQVVVVDNLASGRRSNLNPQATFYHLDIRSKELADVFASERPEVVNHHAAQMDVRRSVADPLYDADVNVLGTLNLLENARQFGVQKVIYSSSGGTVYGEPEYLPCDENHPIRPICQYGGTKYMVELYLYMYQVMYGLDYVVFRYPNVYGPRQDPHGEAGVTAIFIGQMLRGEPVTIFGDGEQERDFVFVGDIADANLRALESRRSGVYNLGSNLPTSVNQIFHTLKEVIHYPSEARYGPAKLGETRRIYLTGDKAFAELGWKARINLHDGLWKTVEYQRIAEAAA